jgi:hypothetical protein
MVLWTAGYTLYSRGKKRKPGGGIAADDIDHALMLSHAINLAIFLVHMAVNALMTTLTLATQVSQISSAPNALAASKGTVRRMVAGVAFREPLWLKGHWIWEVVSVVLETRRLDELCARVTEPPNCSLLCLPELSTTGYSLKPPLRHATHGYRAVG